MDVRIKKRLWQSGKSKDCIMIELYKPGVKPDELNKEVKKVKQKYKELGWKLIDLMISLDDFLIKTEKVIMIFSKGK